MNRSAAHQKVVKDILLEFGSLPIMRIWPNNTGAIKTKDRYIKFGLKGSADIIGIAFDGRFLSIEVKTGKAVQTKEQKSFQAMIEKFGGLYILARSAKCVKEILEKEGYLL